MKFPLFPKNEIYINIIITLFTVFITIMMFFRIPNDRNNLSVAVFFDNDPSVLFYTGKEEITENVKIVIPLTDVEENPKDFLNKVQGRYVGIMEFYGDINFVQEFYQTTRYNKIVKVHYVKPNELVRYNHYTLFKRFWRAVMERSVEVIIIPRSEMVLESLNLFKDFFQVSTRIPEPDNTNWNSKTFGIILALYVILQAPFAILAFIFFNDYWLFISIISIIGTVAAFFSSQNRFTKVANIFILGLLTNFSLYSFEYLNDLQVYRGVKLSLLTLPIVVAFSTFGNLYKEKRINLRHIIATSIIGILAVIYMILRSGNYGYVLDMEEKIRLTLENIFIIRPRIKELLFLPMFFLAGELENAFLKGLLTFFGTFGLVSIFNSFCHLKAPIYIVFYREITTVLVAIVVYLVFVLIRSMVLIWTRKK
ncbi:DUF5693 family protein [Fervidobacterium sp.]